MKKLFSLILCSILFINLVGCSKENNINNKKDDSTLTIGVTQILEHPALDAAIEGFKEGLKENNVPAEVIIQSAQGEPQNAKLIAEKFVKDNVDLIFAVSTPSAQAAAHSTKDIPILFTAVTDAYTAGLVETGQKSGDNITGTLDMAPIKKQLSLFQKIDPSIKDIAVIFSTGEANSTIQVQTTKEIASQLGLNIIEIGISNLSELPQAAQKACSEADGIYTITDNLVASGIEIIASAAKENHIITVGSEEAHVKGGILISDGLSYFELGKQTALMAKKILVDKESIENIPISESEHTKLFYNPETLNQLNLDEHLPIFQEAEILK